MKKLPRDFPGCGVATATAAASAAAAGAILCVSFAHERTLGVAAAYPTSGAASELAVVTLPTSHNKINFNFLRENIFVKTFARKYFSKNRYYKIYTI